LATLHEKSFKLKANEMKRHFLQIGEKKMVVFESTEEKWKLNTVPSS